MNDISLMLGKTNSGMPVRREHPENPHASITGRSGSGKSYFLRGLLEEAAQSGVTCVVLNYSNDYVGYAPPVDIPYSCIDVSDSAFSINPLADAVPQMYEVCAQRLMSALSSAFRLGSRAMLSMHDATIKYLKEEQRLPTIENLLRYVEEHGLWGTYVTPLKLLSSLLRSGPEPIGIKFDRPGVTVLGFAQIADRQMRSLIVELVLQGIWNQRTVRQDWEHPMIVLLDEAQNISWRECDMAVRILREGRKYGFGGWFSTQWLDKSKPEAVAALGQAALQATFRPDDANVLSLAKQMANGNKIQVPQYQKALRSLRRGQFLLQRLDGRAIIVNVPARNEKGGNEQR